MALGINTETGSGSDFLPVLKYDSKAGRMFISDRVQGANGWETVNSDITMSQPTFLIDLGDIDIGWISFASGAPNVALVKVGQPLLQRPTPDHKQGVRMLCYSTKAWQGTREWMSTAKSVLGVIDQLHDAFSAAPEATQGKLPVVKLANVKEVATQTPHGVNRNYAPVLEIVGWADRPADFGQKPTSNGNDAAQTAPAPAQAASPVPPPVTRPDPSTPPWGAEQPAAAAVAPAGGAPEF